MISDFGSFPALTTEKKTQTVDVLSANVTYSKRNVAVRRGEHR